MNVEKLTDEERRDLWLGDAGVDWQRKALRIVDQPTEASSNAELARLKAKR